MDEAQSLNRHLRADIREGLAVFTSHCFILCGGVLNNLNFLKLQCGHQSAMDSQVEQSSSIESRRSMGRCKTGGMPASFK
jgi:hypothetical protein